MAITGNQEVRSEVLSESVDGRPILIALDYTVAADVTPIHIMTVDDVSDAVWLQVHNTDTSASVDLNLILNPSDDTSTASIDAATITVTIPRGSSSWVLQGERFRLIAAIGYTIAAYTSTADVNKLQVTGWFTRVKGTDLTP